MQVEDKATDARGPASAAPTTATAAGDPAAASAAPGGGAGSAGSAGTAGAGGGPGGANGSGGPARADSVPIRLDVQPPREDPPRYTQAELAGMPHVAFSGTVACEACSGALVLRVTPFQQPGALSGGGAPSPWTSKPLTAVGAFEVLAPKGDDPVVLELLVDGDGDGQPDRGERMAVVVADGELRPNADRAGLRIDASDGALGPAGAPPNPNGP